MQKLRVAIIFGGKSAEHEVSIQSAKNVYQALDKTKYNPVLFGITKSGQWISFTPSSFLQIADQSYQAIPEIFGKMQENRGVKPLVTPFQGFHPSIIDVVFPVLHGPFGEDGTIQGFLKTVSIPFVGAGVLGSALGMDKDVMKRLLRDANLPIGKFIVLRRGEEKSLSFEEVTKKIGLPVFVKPTNLGSSIGVSKVGNNREYQEAVKEAFKYDKKILIEEYIEGREIECSVLGNEHPITSVAGEIIPQKEFYDYSSKYISVEGAVLKIPAEISKLELEKVQTLSIETFKTLSCEGLARVDFFLTKKGDVYVNEINTIPGFTKISMFPALWEKSGIGYGELLDRLIELALERQKRDLRFEIVE